jgi:NagD protein
MVGDQMDTDIIAGVQTGMDTILGLPGLTRLDGVAKFPFMPTSICDSVVEIEV